MSDRIAVFTEVDSFYDEVIESIDGVAVKVIRCSLDQYRSQEMKDIKMCILDLSGRSDNYGQLMNVFQVKCIRERPVLVYIDNEDRRYLLNLFTFGVEDYIKSPVDLEELRRKVMNILRYQRWKERYGQMIK